MCNYLVSVIIPTYKRQTHILKRAIDSVLNQTYKNIEIIVVDDSPADYEYRHDIERMIMSLNSNTEIKLIKHGENRGACVARNTGINAAKGNYIAFLDDDDEWLPAKLQKQMELMINSDYGLVYCRHNIINDNTQKHKTDKRKCFEGFVFEKLILENFIGSTSFAVVKKECFDKVGLFNEDLESAQDYEMWLRIAQYYKVSFVNEPLVNYHEHGSGRITDNPNKKIQGLETLNRVYADYLSKHKKIKAIRTIKLVPYYLNSGMRKKAWQTYLYSVKIFPLNIIYNIKYFRYFFMN